MDSNLVECIVKSWDDVKRVPDYEETFGNLVFSRIQQLSPTLSYRFTRKDRDSPPQHIRLFVAMLESMVRLLGPDMDEFVAKALELGQNHSKYGIKSLDFPVFGKALFYALEEMLGKASFRGPVETSWQRLWQFVSLAMIRGIRSVTVDKHISVPNPVEQSPIGSPVAQNSSPKWQMSFGSPLRISLSKKNLSFLSSKGSSQKLGSQSSLSKASKQLLTKHSSPEIIHHSGLISPENTKNATWGTNDSTKKKSNSFSYLLAPSKSSKSKKSSISNASTVDREYRSDPFPVNEPEIGSQHSSVARPLRPQLSKQLSLSVLSSTRKHGSVSSNVRDTICNHNIATSSAKMSQSHAAGGIDGSNHRSYLLQSQPPPRSMRSSSTSMLSSKHNPQSLRYSLGANEGGKNAAWNVQDMPRIGGRGIAKT